jgi:hypothetical protein
MSRGALFTGAVVHYVSYGTPGGEYGKECRAAIVTEVGNFEPGSAEAGRAAEVGLCVLNPTGQFFNRGVPYHDGAETPGAPDCPNKESHGPAGPFRYCSCGWAEPSYKGGTWHRPERGA